jgi:CHAT domain-containing protein/Tfp pilus assembly protein PilF
MMGALRVSAAVLLLGLGPNLSAAPIPQAAPGPASAVPIAGAPPVLELGGTVEHDLPPDGRDEFSLPLEMGRYARLAFKSAKAELAVSLLGPGREVIAQTAGSEGYLSLISAAGGSYRVVVTGFDAKTPSRYQITLPEVRPTRPGDEERVAAEADLSAARLLEAQTKYGAAVKRAQSALAGWRKLQDREGELDALYEIGAAYDSSGEDKPSDKKEASRWYGDALNLAVEIKNRFAQAKAQTALGILLFNDKTDKACEYLRAALPVWQELRDNARQADILYRLGNHDYGQGRIDEAKKQYERAMELADLDGALQRRADSRMGLGNVYGDLGESQKALDYYSASLEYADKGGYLPGKAAALTGQGKLLLRQGKPQEALEKLGRALAINRGNQGSKPNVGIVLVHIGAAYLAIGQPGEALVHYQQALKALPAKGGNPRTIANAFWGIGQAEVAQGRYRQALADFKRASNVKDGNREAAALRGSGIAQLRLHNTAAAVQSLKAALSQGRDEVGKALTLQALGKVYQERGDLGRAADSLQQALDIFSGQVEAFFLRAAVEFDLAQIERQRNRLEAALARIQDAIKILDAVRSNLSEDRLRTSFFASRRSYYDFYVDLLMELERRKPGHHYAEAALAASEEGRARGLLALLAKGKFALTQGISGELKQQEEEARAQLSRLQAELTAERSERARPSVLNALKASLHAAEERQGQVEQAIKTSYPRYYQVRYASTLGYKEIQKLLDKDSALLEYSLAERGAYLFVVTTEGLRVHRLKRSPDDIVKIVQSFRAMLERPGPISLPFLQAAQGLYRDLVDPAREEIKDKRWLLIAPDGVLLNLSFEALLTGDVHDPAHLPYLIQKHTVSYVPSASVLSSLPEGASSSAAGGGFSKRFLAFAPLYGSTPSKEQARSAGPPGSSLAALEGVGREVDAIARRYPPGEVTVYRGAEASKENVQRRPLKAQRIHFAAHGMLDGDHPESSGLILAGRKTLRVNEIFNLKLAADLVVLSACETAGKAVTGEGLVGLSRAFLYAGSPSVVVTLWRVADSSTPDLMLRLYENLDQSGDKAEALRQAKLGMIQRGGAFAHPYYWAPFILVGKPR